MKAPRFTLRFLLAFVTIAAVGLGGWNLYYAKRAITATDWRRIHVGDSMWQVRWKLGPPKYTFTSRRTAWGYDVADSTHCFDVVFDGQRVVVVEPFAYQAGIIPFDSEFWHWRFTRKQQIGN